VSDPVWYQGWREDALEALMDKNSHLYEKFSLGNGDSWDVDLDAETLTFIDRGRPRVVATIQVVGDIAIMQKTWLWAWANDAIPDSVTKAARATQQFGEKNGIDELTSSLLRGDSVAALDTLGWAMTAVTARLTDALGGYRSPTGNNHVFLIYRDMRLAESA
jgi:hypothetical protein